ncbi:MAG: Npun_F0813 family protein [Pseudanabaena sp.]
MFILKRHDVEIINVPNPQNKDQQIPILQYQGQTFRLINMFGDNRDKALALWRDLTDNKGKACVLLEEPQRFSVWGRVKLDQMHTTSTDNSAASNYLVQGSLLILQAVYLEVEDFLGTRQAGSFKQDLLKFMQQGKFAQSESINALETVLSINPLNRVQLPNWDESRLQLLLGEIYRLGYSYLGNDSFVYSAIDALNELPESASVIAWLQKTPKGKLWQ